MLAEPDPIRQLAIYAGAIAPSRHECPALLALRDAASTEPESKRGRDISDRRANTFATRANLGDSALAAGLTPSTRPPMSCGHRQLRFLRARHRGATVDPSTATKPGSTTPGADCSSGTNPHYDLAGRRRHPPISVLTTNHHRNEPTRDASRCHESTQQPGQVLLVKLGLDGVESLRPLLTFHLLDGLFVELGGIETHLHAIPLCLLRALRPWSDAVFE